MTLLQASSGQQLRETPFGSAIISAEPVLYSLFGLTVRSSIRLPMTPIQAEDHAQPTCVFEIMPSSSIPPVPTGALVSELACTAPCHGGRVVTRVHRGPLGDQVWHESVGTFVLAPDASRVTVYPIYECDPGLLQMFLIGQISTLLLLKLGCPSLHSSAIHTERGAIVFLGPRGKGKSTMAASFLRDGDVLITDDALPLRVQNGTVYGGPGVSIMKLWNATAEHTLHLAEELPNFIQNYEKKILTLDGRYQLLDEPVPIRAIYVLDRFDAHTNLSTAVGMRRLSAREGHSVLIAQTSWAELLLPRERAGLVPLYAKLLAQAPVRLLRYPSGFEFQESVRASILADTEQL